MKSKTMFKLWSLMLSIVLVISCVTVLAACGEEPAPEHTHTFESAWTFDTNNHWHKASCEHTTETDGLAPHTMKDHKCTVCTYEEEIPVDPDAATCNVSCPVCGRCIDVFCKADAKKCGDNLTSNIFEAENAELTAGKEGADARLPSVDEDPDPDGGTMITIGHFSRNVPAKVTYKITANKAATVTFKLRTSKNNDYKFRDSLNVYINGTLLKDRNSYIDSNDGWGAMTWLNLGCINLKAGENTIVFECFDKEDGATGGCLDKIELLSASDVKFTWNPIDNSKK